MRADALFAAAASNGLVPIGVDFLFLLSFEIR
jgi:hypothetical protein